MYVQIVDTRPSSDFSNQPRKEAIGRYAHTQNLLQSMTTKEDPGHVNATTAVTYILHSADVGSVWQAVLYSNYCMSEILQNVTVSEKRDHLALFYKFFNFWQFSRYHISATIDKNGMVFGTAQVLTFS